MTTFFVLGHTRNPEPALVGKTHIRSSHGHFVKCINGNTASSVHTPAA